MHYRSATGPEEAQIIASQNGTAATASSIPDIIDWNHQNLNDIDDSRALIDPGVYTFEINKIESVEKEVKKVDSAYFGQSLQYLKGSFTIVDDPKYSGRKQWSDFCTAFKVPLVFLKKISQATGVLNEEGQTLSDWAAQFANLNPPARFQAEMKQVQDRRDPTGKDLQNEIAFFTCRPV